MPLPTINGEQFGYCDILTIDIAATTLTDFQIKKTIVWVAHMQTDFADLRFTTLDGTTIPYWIESKTDSVTAEVWLKIQSISAASTTRALMYYGNPTVISASDGSSVFDFFDDFSGDLSKWEGDTSIASISSGILTISGTGNDYRMNGIIDIPQPYIARFRGNIVPKDDYIFGLFSKTSLLNDDVEYYTTSSVGRFYTSSSSTRTFVSIDTPTSGYKNYDIVYTSGNAHIFVDGVEDLNSPKTDNVPTASLPLGFRTLSNNTDWLFDYVYARKYTAVEPTWAADSGEQHQRIVPQFM